MEITLMVAAAENGVIGADNRLPWHLPADLRYFARQTKGKTLLMGRRTYESLGPTPERPNPLAGRRLIVVSSDPDTLPEGDDIIPVSSVRNGVAWAEALEVPELMVVGGAGVFAETLPWADRLRLTRVHTEPVGDTYFPHPDPAEWHPVDSSTHPADFDNPHPYTFWVLERRRRMR